jgi:hypothetical protein
MSKEREKLLRAYKAGRKLNPKALAKVSKERKNPLTRYELAPGELPEKFIKDVIAEAMHASVNSVFKEIEDAGLAPPPVNPHAKMMGRCLYYAGAGQYLATKLLKRDYCVVAGSLTVQTGPETAMKIDAANGGIERRSFHMWLAADDGGIIDYIDFTSGFYKDWAQQSKCAWERDDVPSYIWGTAKEIHQHQVHLKDEPSEDAAGNRVIEENEKVIALIVKRATEWAANRLGAQDMAAARHSRPT